MRADLLALLLLAACSQEPPPEGGCEPYSVASDVSFDEAHMLCVEITMEPSDFEALGKQYRFGGGPDDQWPGVIGHVVSSCSTAYPDPYTYFSADISVDGARLDDVGVRKKGFIGSVQVASEERPSLKIKTDRFVDGQRLGETERITLNNNLTDPTRMHTCLSYSLFHDAGHPAPLCNLAHVFVNGRSVGAYSHVEAIKKRFLRRAFGNDEGSLYEATIADFTETHLAGLPDTLGHWEPKTDETDLQGAPLFDVIDALEAPDAELAEALDEVIDLEGFLQFWALETLVGHEDGFNGNANNSYVYFDPDRGGRAVFIPWGTDDAMTNWGVPGLVASTLAQRLSRHPELSQRYLDELQVLLDEVYDETVLEARIATWRAQVRAAELQPGQRDPDVDELLGWVWNRRGAIQVFIDAGGVEGPAELPNCTGYLDPEDLVGMGEIATLTAHGCSTLPARAWVALAPIVLLALKRRRSR